MMPVTTTGAGGLVSVKWILLDAILGGILKQVALLAVAFWVLPVFGYYLPLWVVIIVGLGLAVQSAFSCMLAIRLNSRKPMTGLQTMVGKRCVTVTELNPEGYVKVDGELWRAIVADGVIGAGESVVIISAKGMTLTVKVERQEKG